MTRWMKLSDCQPPTGWRGVVWAYGFDGPGYVSIKTWDGSCWEDDNGVRYAAEYAAYWLDTDGPEGDGE